MLACCLTFLAGRPANAQFAFYEFAGRSFRATEGSSAATFEIVRWGNTNIGFSVGWMAVNGTATAGVDFVGVTNTLLFAPGETNKTVGVPLLDDGWLEEAESIVLRFGSATAGATTGAVDQAELIVEDNEIPSLVDGDFTPSPAPADDVFAVLLQPDGKILAGGQFDGLAAPPVFVTRPGVARFNADGAVDETFVTSPAVGAGVYALALQADGKIVLGGGFTGAGTQARRFLARLDPDGSLDSSFGPNANDEIRAVVVQPDGKILIAGRFTSVNGQPRGRVARLNADGSLDPTFAAGGGADNNIRTLVLQPDGRILIGGQFVNYSGTARARVARLEADGSLDGTFDPGGGADGQVRAIASLADGSIYIGGDFNTYNGAAQPALVRLWSNGTQDLGFRAGLRTADAVRAIGLEPDGKVLIGGSFRSVSGLTRTNVARLLTNGLPDTTLLSTRGPNDEVFAIARQDDGRIVIGGQFVDVAGAPRPFLARLLPDSRARTMEYAAAQFFGAESHGRVTITARRAGESDGEATATFFTSDGSAVAPQDYVGVTDVLQFSPRQVTRTFTVPLVNDGVVEGMETVRLGITNVTGAAPGALRTADLLLFDGSGYSGLYLYPPILSEEGPGAGVLVTRIGPTNFPLAVYYSTRDGTARAGVDYEATTGVFQLAPGQTDDYIILHPINDSLQEGPEDFFLDLRDTPGGPIVGTTRAVIIDNESGVGLWVDGPALTVGEESGSVTVYVVCAWDPAQPLEVDYATRDLAGAVAGMDYLPQSGTLTFTTNQQAHAITVPILNDNVVEPLKAFAIQLTALRGPALLTVTNVLVDIVDNDQGIECVTNQISVGEGDGVARVAVRRRDDGTNLVTVDYRTEDGSAVGGVGSGDFTPTQGTLVLPPGPEAHFISIPIREDLELEAEESFRLVLQSPTGGASLGRVRSTEVRIVDNDRPGSPDLRFRVRGVDPFDLQFLGQVTLAVQPDGKVLVGDWSLIRVLPDGQADTSFNVVRAFPGQLVPAVLPDGRIILGTTQSNSLAGFQCAFRLETNGVVDPTFQTDVRFGRTTTVVLAPDGGIYLGGSFDLDASFNQPDPPGSRVRAVVRLFPGGATDTNFDAGEFLPAAVYYQSPSTVEAMILQPDGRLVAGGIFTRAAGRACDRIVRLNTNGAVDQSFFLGGGAGATNEGAVVLALALQSPDGKLLVGGDFSRLQGVPRPGLTRLHSDGTVDEGFHPALQPGMVVRAIVVQPDRKILVAGGSGASFSPEATSFVLRLFPDGALDETFDPGPIAGTVSDLVLLPDGDVLAGGSFGSFHGLDLPAIVRLNGGSPRYSRLAFEPESLTLVEQNGMASFTIRRTGDTNWVSTIQFATVAETAGAGDFEPRSGQLTFLAGEVSKTIEVPILDDWLAEPDETFRVTLFDPGLGTAVLLQSSAQVTILDNDRPGSLDLGFAVSPDPNSSIHAIAVQPDGKILIAGDFCLLNGVFGPSYARLNVDGTLDPDFIRESSCNWDIRLVTLQPDGRILLGGAFRSLQGFPRLGVCRLLANGAVDPSFTSPLPDSGNLSEYINALSLDPSGRILLAGAYSRGPGDPLHQQLTRLLPNGAIDPTFVTSSNFASVQPYLAAAMHDGRVLVAGTTLFDGFHVRPYVGRLLADGALDPGFSTAIIREGWISSILPLPDGSALIAGGFTAINGIPAGCVAHLLADGTPAPFTAPGLGADGSIYTMLRQPDGRILIGGLFETVNGVPRHQLARLNADLTLDTSFDPGRGFAREYGSIVLSLGVQSDGQILAGGNFASVSGMERINLARLRGVLGPCLSPLLTPVPGGLRLNLIVAPGGTYVLESSPNLRDWIPWQTNVAAGSLLQVIVPPMTDAPQRFYRAVQPGP